MATNEPPKVTVTELVCKHCGHRWTPRSGKAPKVCPNPRCHSRSWWREPNPTGVTFAPRKKKVA